MNLDLKLFIKEHLHEKLQFVISQCNKPNNTCLCDTSNLICIELLAGQFDIIVKLIEISTKRFYNRHQDIFVSDKSIEILESQM